MNGTTHTGHYHSVSIMLSQEKIPATHAPRCVSGMAAVSHVHQKVTERREPMQRLSVLTYGLLND